MTPEIVIHRASERGVGEHGWLKTAYSFSFADWYNPTRMGFGRLRVLNDDVIAPDHGFSPHSHADMEIITIVTAGAVTHADSMGNTGVVPAGDVQVMSAGIGVTHSEINASPTEELRLFQIWVETKTRGIVPRYEQKAFDFMSGTAGETLLVSPDNTNGSLRIIQDAYITHLRLPMEQSYGYQVKKGGSGVYLLVTDGEVAVGEATLGRRDAIGIKGLQSITISANAPSEVLIIEVPLT